MKVAIKVKNLLKGVNICSRLVSSRSSLEVLGNILIETDKNILKLSSTNLDLAITTKLGAKVEKEGKISIPARLLGELINSISEDTLQLIADNTNLTIKGQGIHSRLNGVAASEFPTLPQLSNTKSLKFKSEDLKTNFEKVIASVSIDESRPVLAGVYFNLSEGQLVLAGTDSYRLSEINSKNESKENISCIIPVRTVSEVLRLISSEEVNEVEIKIGESEICFIIGESQLISQLTEGKYPDYAKIIPESTTTTVECDKDKLVEAVKISSVFARESSHGITLNIVKDEMTFDAQTSDIGENTIKVPVKKTGNDASISVNAKYITDIVSVIDEKSVIIGINDKLDPLLLKPAGKKESEVHIIMPLRS
jgi:DNA polymerase-3 subunit beta